MKPPFLLLTILWSFTVLGQNEFYFVAEASANWSNIQNWRTASGGSVQYDQIPTTSSTVIIDENSFRHGINEIVVDLNLAVCQDIRIETSGNFTFRISTGHTLVINGSVMGSANANYDFAGNLEFGGAGTKAINFGRDIRVQNFRVNGQNGEWTFTDNYYVENGFTLQNGTVHFSDLSINALHGEFSPSARLQANFTNVETNFRYDEEVRGQVVYTGTNYTIGFPNPSGTDLNFESSRIRLAGEFPTIYIGGRGELDFDVLELEATGYSRIGWASAVPNTVILNINELQITGNTRMYADINAGSVNIEAGSAVELASSGSYTWDEIEAVGTCLDLISLSSEQATIQTQNTRIEQAVLINITFQGNAQASYTSLLGTTSGIDVMDSSASTFYWIGGNGDWNDGNHWSISSGGSPAGCIPSGSDDVVFDNQSFSSADQSVSIGDNAYVNNFQWQLSRTGNTLELGSNAILFINGSMLYDQEGEIDNDGQISFVSDTDEVIRTSGTIFTGNLVFRGQGSWRLESDMVSDGKLDFFSGRLILNSFALSSNGIDSRGNLSRILDLSGSRWYIRKTILSGTIYDAYFAGEQFSIESEDSHIFIESGVALQFFMPANYASMVLDSLTVRNARASINSYRINNLHVYFDYLNLEMDTSLDGIFTTGELWLTEDNVYQFGETCELNAQSVMIHATCEAYMAFLGGSESNPAVIDFPSGTEIRGLIAQNIHTATHTIQAPGGRDTGNNSGIDFTQGSGRTLYWVGGSGAWQESEHWALSSGGSGGACPPGPHDNVVFDGNSFGSADDVVRSLTPGNANYSCRSFTWTENALSNRIFIIRDLFVFGSVYIGQPLAFQLNFHFMSPDEEEFYFQGSSIYHLYVNGTGTYTIRDDVRAHYIYFRNGSLDFQNSGSVVNRLFLYNDIDGPLNLTNSVLEINDPFGSTLNVIENEVPFGIDCDISSRIEMTGSQNTVRTNSDTEFGRLIIRNPNSNNIFSRGPLGGSFSFRYLEITGNNTLNGSFEVDSMIVHPGHRLLFEPATHTTVRDYFQYLGNNCLTSIWSNLNPGTSGTINFEVNQNTNITQDHIQMTGIRGQSPTVLPAGPHSTNINNSNPGWTFEERGTGERDYGILGPDVHFCDSIQAFTLNENNIFSASEISWNGLSGELEYRVTQPGAYRVRLSYSNGCELTDTLVVSLLENVSVDLGDDIDLCQGDSAVISAEGVSDGFDFSWNTGESARQITVREAGTYAFTIEAGECTISDSVQVMVFERPDLILRNHIDTARCEGSPMELDLSALGNVVIWQGESVQGIISIDQSGLYRAEVIAGTCSDADSIEVTFYPPPELTLVASDPICAGESTEIRVESTARSILWEDGHTEFVRTVNPVASTVYLFDVRSEVCTLSDSILVEVHPTPVTNIFYEKDFLCEDEQIVLEAETTGNALEWSNGSGSGTLEVSLPGTYYVRGFLNQCMDSVAVEIATVERADPGLVSDTVICQDESLVLSPAIGPLTNIRWNGISGGSEMAFQGNQLILLEAEYNGCPVADSTLLSTIECGPSEIGLPNVFSPNHDGMNEVYRPIFNSDLQILEYQFRIFDRWGNLIFDTDDPNAFWDGNELDGIVGAVLAMRYTNSSGREFDYEGSTDVMILR